MAFGTVADSETMLCDEATDLSLLIFIIWFLGIKNPLWFLTPQGK